MSEEKRDETEVEAHRGGTHHNANDEPQDEVEAHRLTSNVGATDDEGDDEVEGHRHHVTQ